MNTTEHNASPSPSHTEGVDVHSALGFDSKIYVAGHRGLVGSAIWNNLRHRGYENLVGRTHHELDLMDPVAVRAFFDAERPDAVVLAAAHVGGIMANLHDRADFIFQNLQIQQNVIGEAWRHGVQRLLFLGSTCIYPREAPQPMREDSLLTSPLEYTNEPYAIAKIAGLKLCESLNLQYGTNYIAVMPTNLYGPNDNFDPVTSHVLPAMIRKFHDAKMAGDDAVTLWGSGTPKREFLWSEDMADASVHVLLNVDFRDTWDDAVVNSDGIREIRNCHINVGTGIEHSIREVAEMVRQAVGFQGEIRWDRSKPDGTPRKLTDVTKLHRLGWHHTVSLDEGIRRLYKWYLDHVESH